VTQQEAAAYFDAVFNTTTMSATDQEESIIQYYLKAASMAKKSNSKSEPNGRAMSKVMEMFNGHGRGAELASAKDTAYGLLCSITEFV
ncbi:DUF932 domain-containing protein, partial [Klebsiella pneumoniae]|uniref:DUF932 domain-containing protein n=1 Tax=Klebsiella pneumoniae TaxID=573 RepID=UPI002245AEDC